MPDRELHYSARITADLPGLSGQVVTVTVRDSVDAEILSETAVHVGGQRYRVDLPALEKPGLWEATWDPGGDGDVLVQRFIVGVSEASSLSKYQLRNAIIRRVGSARSGLVLAGTASSISDETVIGGERDYLSSWIIPGPGTDNEAMFRSVSRFSGGTFHLSAPVITAFKAGEPYTVSSISPFELDEQTSAVLGDLARLARVPITVPDVSVGSGSQLVIPRGITYVLALTRNGTALESWHLLPGRRIQMFSDEAVTVHGYRSGSSLVWEDSLLDTGPEALIAGVAYTLHAQRAGSQATDLDEHLRRQIAAEQKYESALKRFPGRVPAGARKVIE